MSQIPCLSDVSGSDSSLPFGHLILGTRFSEVFATSLSSLEKEMATHSSTLVWKIPWTEEHGRPMGLQRVGHD